MSLGAVPVYLLARRLDLTQPTSILCAALALLCPGHVLCVLPERRCTGLPARAHCHRGLRQRRREARPLGRGRRSRCHRTGVLRAGPVRDPSVRRSCWRQSLRSGGLFTNDSERSRSRSVLPPRWLRSFRSSVRVLLGRYETVTTFSPSSEALHWVFSRHVPARSRRGRGVRSRRGRVLRRLDRRGRYASPDCVCHDGPVRHGLARPDRLRDDGGNELRSIPRALPDHRRSAHRACLRLLAVGEASRSDGSRSLPGVGMLLVAMRLTLSQFTVVQGVADSPSLFALSPLETDHGRGACQPDRGADDLPAGAALGVALALRRSLTALPAWLFTGALFVAVALGAVSGRPNDRSAGPRTPRSPGPVDWIDRSGADDVLLVQTPGSQRFDAMLTSVLNKSIVEAKALGKTRIQDFDGLAGTVDITESGTLTSGGHPVRRPVAFGIGGTAASFTGARSTVYDRSWVLVRPRGRVRLSMLADGVRSDGRLSPRGEITLYPQADRGCTFLQSSTVGAPGAPSHHARVQRAGWDAIGLDPTRARTGCSRGSPGHRGDPDSLPDAVARQLSTESIRRNGGEGRLVVETCAVAANTSPQVSSPSCRCPAHDRRHPDPKSPARAARRRRARRARAACRTPASPRERRRVDNCRADSHRRTSPPQPSRRSRRPARPPLLPFRQSSFSRASTQSPAGFAIPA